MASTREAGDKIAYHNVQSEERSLSVSHPSQRSLPFEECERLSKSRSWTATIIVQIGALLWLVPIVVLLYFNFSEYIIGASAWCPGGHCHADSFTLVSTLNGALQHTLAKVNKGDHDLLGALQFVAKALEVWFSVIAAAFVYLITMRIAGSKEGLPVGYLTRPFEFADIISVFDPLLWTTGPTPWGSQKSEKEKRLGRKVVGLIALSFFLCVLCNLMGPATAVLVLPTLGWVTTKSIGNYTFTHLNAAQAPTWQGDPWFWWSNPGCNFVDFENYDFSCTHYPFGESLDTLVQSYVASGIYANGYTHAGPLTLTYNASLEASRNGVNGFNRTDYVFWAPSRQVFSNFTVDISVIQDISLGYSEQDIHDGLAAVNTWPDPIDTYAEYNKSLELVLQRNGPVSGGLANMWNSLYRGNNWTVEVDSARQIRCYSFYDLDWSPVAQGTWSGNYTKCIRTGGGWSDQNHNTTFSIEGFWNDTTQSLNPSVNVEVFSSDRAAFFENGILPTWLPAPCLADGPISDNTVCDWNRLFTIDPTSPVANRSENINTIQFTTDVGDGKMSVAVDFTAFYNFTTYSINPSIVDNPTQLVQTQSLPTTGTPFAVHPAWILAAWSVDQGGVLPSDRATTHFLLESLQELIDNPPDLFYTDNPRDAYRLGWVALLPIIQTLSIIDYSTVMTSNTDASKQDPSQPLLQRNAQIYVWAYSLGTRTAWLGVVVAILGCIVVLAQVYLGFVDRREYRSPTQLLVAALEHAPQGEFHDRYEEKLMARTRFHIKDNMFLAGKLSFYEPEDKGQLSVDTPKVR